MLDTQMHVQHDDVQYAFRDATQTKLHASWGGSEEEGEEEDEEEAVEEEEEMKGWGSLQEEENIGEEEGVLTCCSLFTHVGTHIGHSQDVEALDHLILFEIDTFDRERARELEIGACACTHVFFFLSLSLSLSRSLALG
jgi:hypothetical protein